jgi:hypothetical protein
VLWIRIGSNAVPDPASYLNVDPDQGANQMGIHADLVQDSNPGETFKLQKVEFCMRNILKVGTGIGKKNIPSKVQKPLERKETMFFC